MSSKHGRKLQGAREVFDDFEVGRADQFHQQFLVVEDEIAQAVGAFLVELVALHRGEHGAEDFRPEDVGKGVVAVLGQPEQQFAAGGVLADEPGQRFLELLDLAFVDEQAGQLAAELGRDAVQRRPQHLVPVLGIGGLEGFQRAAVLGGRKLLHQRAELGVLRPDRLRREFAFGRAAGRAIARMSSRTKMASRATAGCVRW